jgi:hypothetical protein
MSLRETIRKEAELRDGQREREVAILRRVKLQKPIALEVSAPRACASAIAAVFGSSIAPAVRLETHREKLLRIEVERYRWMRPGPDGKLIPREL